LIEVDSLLSVSGSRLLHDWPKRNFKSRFDALWKSIEFGAGMLLLITARLTRALQPQLRYPTNNVCSLAVDMAVDERVTARRSRIFLPQRQYLASRALTDVDLYFNVQPEFTKWVVNSGLLQEKFVLVDVGVLGGENPRWHLLREYLVVHGFDANKDAIDELHRVSWDPKWDRTYHWMAVGNRNGEKEFFLDPRQPTQGSFGFGIGLQRKLISVRSLDSLLHDGVIPHPDFIKIDVEGYEADVLLGAKELLGQGSVLGMEIETNFCTSASYPKSHFNSIHDVALEHGLKLFDLNFDRTVRPIYQAARQSWPSAGSGAGAGMPTTFNVLLCRDIIAERDGASFYERALSPPTVDQVIKLMSIYELYGLSDVAVDTAINFSKILRERLDVDDALERLCK